MGNRGSTGARARDALRRLAATVAAVAMVAAGTVVAGAAVANAAANATVMATTQRMSGPALTSTQNGWYDKGSVLSLVCHQRGQAVKGYYSQWLPNGGWDDLWYVVSDGYFVADVDINTGSVDPVVPVCPLEFGLAPTPAMTGTARVGSTLSVSTGTWSPAANLGYQWRLNGTVVSTASTWVIPATANGGVVAVSVTGSLIGYATTTRASATARIAAGALTVPTPTMTGTATVGVTLSVVPGSWAPAPVTLRYQWLRGSAAIGGATTSTYKLAPTDAGKQVSVRVTGSKSGYTTAVRTSAARTVGKAFTSAPVPAVSGSGRVGQTLNAASGTWSPAPVALTYQWMRNGSAISGATGTSHKLVTADARSNITVRVTGTKTGYTTVAKVSVAKTIEGLLAAPAPKVTGTPTVGRTLTAVPGTWGPAPVTLTYRWLRDGVAITGATSANYIAASADAARRISVRVSGSKSGYTPTARTSAAVLLGKALSATPVPTVAGTAIEGQTLTARAGSWSPAPVTFGYQWLRRGSAINGATSTTYKLTSADIGQALSVRVTGSKSGYTTVTRTSPTVIPVGLKITGTAPTITGTAQAGATLTAQPGTWAPDPVTLGYQWEVDGSAVSGATAPAWTVPVWAATRSVTVTITGSRAGYPSATYRSAAVRVSGVIGSAVGPDNVMLPGTSLHSANGQYAFEVQTDGNLVVYRGATALWSSNTGGQAIRYLAVQSDGNLVMYRTDGAVGWASGTNGKTLGYLAMQDDGNLVLYNSGNAAIWASNTTQGAGGAGPGGPGVNGWVYPIQPHSTLTTYTGHNGDDFPVPTGTPVYAMSGGTVRISTYAVTSAWCPVPSAIGRMQTDLVVTGGRDGKTYAIDYAHLSSFAVPNGATVQPGQLLGYSGANGCVTGPHLHVDIKVDGIANVLYPHNLFGWSY